MIKLICDACKKEVEKKNGFGHFILLRKRMILNNNMMGQNIQPEELEFHLCPDCSEKIIKEFDKK